MTDRLHRRPLEEPAAFLLRRILRRIALAARAVILLAVLAVLLVTAAVADAHAEPKLALGEMRALARGIHPAVLTDRGLDAALSALAGRAGVPVDVDVVLARRPPTAVESAAYFVVAEALTNVARHASATRASVSIVEYEGLVIVEISDDGIGGNVRCSR